MRAAPRPWVLQSPDGLKRYQTRSGALSGQQAWARRGVQTVISREDEIGWKARSDMGKWAVDVWDGKRWVRDSVWATNEGADTRTWALNGTEHRIVQIDVADGPRQAAMMNAAKGKPVYPEPAESVRFVPAGWYLFQDSKMLAGPFDSEREARAHATSVRNARTKAAEALAGRLRFRYAIDLKRVHEDQVDAHDQWCPSNTPHSPQHWHEQ